VTAPVPILFTIPNFTTAGSGQAMLQIVRRLDRTRFAPSVAVLKRGGHLEQEVERLGIPYIASEFTVNPRPLWSLPVRARRAARAFRSGGFVLWHSFHYLDDYTEPLVARYAEVSPDGRDHFPVVIAKIADAADRAGLAAAELAAVACPTLVMTADDDLVTLEHTLALYRALPDAQLAVVPGTSHLLLHERPRLCASLVTEFLTTDPAPTLMPLRRGSGN